MKRKEIDLAQLTIRFNHLRRISLGKKYSNEEMVNLLKDVGFVYPTIVFMFLKQGGFIDKYNVQNRKLNIFTSLEITPTQLAQTIEKARLYQKAAQHPEQVQPSQWISVESFMQILAEKLKNAGAARIGIIRSDIDIKAVLTACGVKAQKIQYSYQDL